MAKLGRAIHEIHSLENLAERNTVFCRIHPLAKVLVTVWYQVLVMSFDKKDVTGLLAMSLYLLFMMILGDISIKRAIRRLRPIFLMIILIGAANPFFDRRPVFMIGELAVTGGMLSMMTLLLKAGFAVTASYILIATTSMEEICFALRKLHVPQILVTVLLLIYRYLVLLLKEADRITQAYSLRALGEKGIRKSAWGPLVGQMLLRSMDRAQTVYESMALRGFRGEFFLSPGKCFVPKWQSVMYGFIWGIVLVVLRYVPVFRAVGAIFVI